MKIIKAEPGSFAFLLYLVFIIYVVFSAVSLYQGTAKIDEHRNHLPILQGMHEEGYFNYILSDDYKAANTPLPYFLPYAVFKVFSISPNLSIPRIINFIISFLTVLVFISIYKNISGKLDYRIFIFVFYPYLIKTSYVFYLAIYGLFFLLLGILFLSKEENKTIFFAGISSACGILSQQFIAAFPIGYLVNRFRNKNFYKKKELTRIFLFIVPLFIPIILFVLWGGLTHPNWQFHNPSFDITHLTATFTIIGGVFLPFFIDRLKEIKIKYLLFVLPAAIVLTYFFSPIWAEYGEYGQVTGYTYNFLTKVGSISKQLAFVVNVILCSAGIYIFILLWQSNLKDIEFTILSIASVFMFVYFFNNVFSERHLLPMIALLFLLTLPRVQNKWLLNFWIGFQVLFGIVYYYYWLFIHPSFG